MRAMIRKTLEMSGLPISEVHQAENGKEGLELLGRCWVDVVLVDINMPVMGGLEMVEKLRGDPLLAKLPVVVVSTESSQKRIEEVTKAGVHFVHKPFTPELMREVLTNLLEGLDGARN
jgi:Response regulator containing CheY-like receiver, AAA-type ATPase, and DNA-binding domains